MLDPFHGVGNSTREGRGESILRENQSLAPRGDWLARGFTHPPFPKDLFSFLIAIPCLILPAKSITLKPKEWILHLISSTSGD